MCDPAMKHLSGTWMGAFYTQPSKEYGQSKSPAQIKNEKKEQTKENKDDNKKKVKKHKKKIKKE